ncbi:glycosyltransferase [Candidatus Dojkabacteria bacterium]|nr:glycosyltransferase [Candidatus Dojkabacteria bacterium]
MKNKIRYLNKFALISSLIYAIVRIVSIIYFASQGYLWYERVIIVIFGIAELFVLMHSVGYILSIITSVNSYKRHKINFKVTEWPLVSVLIPVRNEPYDVVFKTVIAAKYLDYSNFEVYLIDGSDKKKSIREMQELCKDTGTKYYEVPYPRHGAKAGSLNELIPQLKSKYIVIFDADYRTSRDFLRMLVPQMEENSKLAFIQTPQFYGNLYTNLISRAAQMQQANFFEYICETKGLSSSIFMCGTNLIIRKTALEKVGGFDESTITEDFATSIKMHLQGWKSSYYNYTCAFGDGPVNIVEYFKQQYRWARGNMETFKNNAREMFSKNLSNRQKWEYMLSGTYYYIGIAKLVLIITPLLYIFFKIPSYLTTTQLYIYVYIPYFLLSGLLFSQGLIAKRYKFLDWLKSESLTFFTLTVFFKAAIDTIINKKSTFETTSKGAKIGYIPFGIIKWQVLLISLNMLALIWGTYLFLYVEQQFSILINLFWIGLHTFLLSYILLELFLEKQRIKRS